MRTIRLLAISCAAPWLALSAHADPVKSADCGIGAPTVIGGIDFDVADRQAVINLVNSYGYLNDSFGPARFDDLFLPDATILLRVGDKTVVDGLPQFKAFSGKRHENFQREGVQRRHVLSAPRFDHQDGTSASGQAYLQYYETRQGETPVLKFIGVYSFRAAKTNGRWKLACWIARTD